jgi:ribonuclease HI
MVMMYKTLMFSVFNYGSSVFAYASETSLEKLEVMNRRCLRVVTGCTKTTPLNTLSAIAGIGPLKVEYEYWTMRRVAMHMYRGDEVAKQLCNLRAGSDGLGLRRRNRTSGFHTYMERVFVGNRSLFEGLAVTKDVCEEMEPRVVTRLGDKFTKGSTATSVMRKNVLEAMETKYKGCRRMFTDASKIGDKCGVGVYDEELDLRMEYRLVNETSIMTAELTGIGLAAKELRRQNVGGVIFTDSKSACEYIATSASMGRCDAVTSEVIGDLTASGTVVQWIPSHIGIAGNETADECARSGVTRGVELNNKILVKDVFLAARRQRKRKLDDWYAGYAREKGKKFYGFQKDFEERPWYWSLEFEAKEIRMLNRIVSGHDYSKYWLNVMGKVEDGSCDECRRPSTTVHNLRECPKWRTVRGKYPALMDGRNWWQVWKEDVKTVSKEILNFAKEIELEV